MNKPRPILLCEDTPEDAELILRALARHDLASRVTVVNDGVETLHYLRRQGQYSDRELGSPAVVLLDIKMPRMDGLETLREIRGDATLRRQPVVMLTSSREERDVSAAYDLGANAYVVKPVDFVQFFEAVGRLGVFWAITNEPPAA